MQLQRKSLFEFCADSMHCYISDLAYNIIKKNRNLKNNLMGVLLELNAMQFDLYEWNEAIAYILDESKQFQDSCKAKDYLINSLKK